MRRELSVMVTGVGRRHGAVQPSALWRGVPAESIRYLRDATTA
jgi:hypothetical protein